ncbi:MAG TPA: SCO family protein [Anaeromyxobacteraceae bacterium]|nr:SCO family protein [Anaeromyxobacteraceae bacterium]
MTAAALALALGAAAPAPEAGQVPSLLESVEIVEHLGDRVPPDATFRDQGGRAVTLGELTAGDQPVVMALVYYECPMLCGLVLGGLARGMRQTGLELGKDFRAVSVSFDPREKPGLALVRQSAYLQSMGKPDRTGDWRFLTGEEPQIRKVTEAVGFKYAWDQATKQFAHAAAIVVLSPGGRISRYLYGVEYPGRDLRLALVEAAQGRVGTSFDRLLLTCYRYDPAARRYVPYAMGFVKAGAALAALVLAGALAVFWRREARKGGVR